MNFPNTPKAEPVRAEKTKKIGNFGIIFGIIKPHLLILGLALFLGIITRFYFLTSYIQFDGEQARSGFILMKMWQGDWPTLGAPSSIGGYGIFPYYYYWTFLWTLLGSDPVFQVLSNAVPSFGSILLIFTIFLFDGKFFDFAFEKYVLMVIHFQSSIDCCFYAFALLFS